MTTENKYLLNYLPPVLGTSKTIAREQEVYDILNEVLNSHKVFAGDYENICLYFYDGNLEDFYRSIFDFCKKNIQYKIENEKNQTTKSASVLLTEGKGDCKHYANFIGGNIAALEKVLNKKINWVYRFASYNGTPIPQHVFIVVKENAKEIWIDPVLDSFNSRRYVPNYFIDKKINKNIMLQRLAGVEKIPFQNPRVSALAVTQKFDLPAGVPDSEISPKLEDDIKQLLYYGVITMDGNINMKLFNSLKQSLPQSDSDALVDAMNDLIKQAQIIGSLFGGILNTVKQVVGAPVRALYLAMVSLNFFGMASRMYKVFYTPSGVKIDAGVNPVEKVWHGKYRGDTNLLLRAVRNGHDKKAILGIGDISSMHYSGLVSTPVVINRNMGDVNSLFNITPITSTTAPGANTVTPEQVPTYSPTTEAGASAKLPAVGAALDAAIVAVFPEASPILVPVVTVLTSIESIIKPFLAKSSTPAPIVTNIPPAGSGSGSSGSSSMLLPLIAGGGILLLLTNKKKKK